MVLSTDLMNESRPSHKDFPAFSLSAISGKSKGCDREKIFLGHRKHDSRTNVQVITWR